jgi:hypothetical protein
MAIQKIRISRTGQSVYPYCFEKSHSVNALLPFNLLSMSLDTI